MAYNLGLDSDSVAGFVEIFLDNFTHFFQKSVRVKRNVQITGREGMYYPLESYISLTNTCSQYCVHCYKNAHSSGIYIDYNVLKAFLDSMSGYTPYLTISGGAPTLHPQFSKLLEEYEDKYSISVFASGYNMDAVTLGSLKSAKLGVILLFIKTAYNLQRSYVIIQQGDNIWHRSIYLVKKRYLQLRRPGNRIRTSVQRFG